MKHILVTLLVPIFLLCISAHALASLRVEDIARQFFPEDYDTLLVGEQTVPILFSEATLPLSRGVVVILVNEGSQVLNLASARELAHSLNDKGWHTLISPSLLVHTAGSASAVTNQPAEDEVQSNPDASPLRTHHPMQDILTPVADFDASMSQTTLLMGAISNYISAHKGFRIVITSGMTSPQMLAAANKGNIAPPDSLITLIPYWPQRTINQAIPQHIASSGFPVLDISIPDANQWEAQTTDERLHAAKTALKLQYRQRRLNSMSMLTATGQTTDSPFSNWLSGEIYGWISHLGW